MDHSIDKNLETHDLPKTNMRRTKSVLLLPTIRKTHTYLAMINGKNMSIAFFSQSTFQVTVLLHWSNKPVHL
jgi:hypothetical protein